MSEGTAKVVDNHFDHCIGGIANHVVRIERANSGNPENECEPREETWPTGGGRDSMRLLLGILVHSLSVAAIDISSPIAGFMTINIKLNTHEIDLFCKPVHLMSFWFFVYRDEKTVRLQS